tara:strand:- start:143 stop:958 length:816 start_codon:yes stop_codon:yes gene_type:complete
VFLKVSTQLFVGNSHYYIFIRLYHVIMERLAAAKEMACKSQELAESDAPPADAETDAENGEAAEHADENGPGSESAAALSASSEQVKLVFEPFLPYVAPHFSHISHVILVCFQASRMALVATLKRETSGDLYKAFLSALRQLIEGKLEASAYEDALRTLLGSNAYILFTLHKIISQALKQLQMLLAEDTSQKLLELYTYERQRVSPGSACPATYRNNARLLLEGDDCFEMEQVFHFSTQTPISPIRRTPLFPRSQHFHSFLGGSCTRAASS